MWRDICLNNPDQIVKHIKGYQQVLDKLSSLIENNESDALENLFSEAKSARDEWIKD
jgi:prephenate dehydrogenase